MKVIKKFLIILLIISIFNLIPNELSTVNAMGTVTNSMNSADNFLQRGNKSANEAKIINPIGVYNVLNTLYGLALVAAITFAVIKGTLIGIKIIFGTIEDKVDAKALLVPYLWIVAGIAFGGIVLKEILKILMSIF